MGYFGTAETLGVWQDNHKTTVSDGYSTFTADNPGWDAYCNHSQISNYLLTIDLKGVDIYGEIETFGVAKYGFVLSNRKIHIAQVKVITKLLQENKDCRPDWIKNATEEKILNPIWMAKYQEYSEASRANFPKYDRRCYQATKEILDWLKNRN